MNYAVILAAGSGIRMQSGAPKVLRYIGGNTVLWHAIKQFDDATSIDCLVLVVPQGMFAEYKKIVSEMNIQKCLDVVEGDITRTQSAFAGLQAVDKQCDFVAIHDAARIMITTEDINGAMRYAEMHGSAVVSGPIFDTIKHIKNNKIVKTIDRSKLMAAYTPQIFKYKELMVAYMDALDKKYDLTDDASIMEKAGYDVFVYDTNKRDIKITVEDDIKLVDAMLAKKMTHVGSGIDTHVLVEGHKLILGGVDIPYEKGLLGHSDADVLVHAIMDALLGAMGMRDIGYHFPDTDDNYKGVSSIALLEKVGQLVNEKSFDVTNIDATIICQMPKLAPYNIQMVQNIAQALKIDGTCINIKATTTEGIGEHGQGKAISAMAVCALLQTI